MKQTIFVHHSVTKWLKTSYLGLITSKAYHYVTQIIKLTLSFSLASKFVQRNVLLPHPKKLSTDKLNPSIFEHG